MDIPVFLINGFLESGKTTFILETIHNPQFADGGQTLLIVCEEGEVEYDEVELAKINISVVTVGDQEEITEDFLSRMKGFYQPERIMIEWNGMFNYEQFLELDLPDEWIMAQIITLIDATTYKNYSSNFKAIMVGQFKYSDTIIVNRCDETTDKITIRRSIKPVNRKAQIIYESADGVTSDAGVEVLPFDINSDRIDLSDEDYGLWYMHAMENPKLYHGKTIRFRAMVYKGQRFPKGEFVPGRFAMTCCADDIAFVGFLCKVVKDTGPVTYEELQNHMWITITASVRVEYYKEYGGKGPVLYASCIEKSEEPEEKLVYFN
jgi:uncharacterized repeat protein (TIGR03943 family)